MTKVWKERLYFNYDNLFLVEVTCLLSAEGRDFLSHFLTHQVVIIFTSVRPSQKQKRATRLTLVPGK